jgi:phosphoglycerate kinase
MVIKINMTIDLEMVRGRTVLFKVAYDIPSLDDTDRIESTLETLHYLLERNNRVLICTHWGRPVGNEENLSTKHLIPVINKLYKQKYCIDLGVQFLDQYPYFLKKNTTRLRRVLNVFKTQAVMLENTRFASFEQAGTISEKITLARQYAEIIDVVVDEAFPLSHRKEVTNTEIKDIKPFCFGFNYLQEIKALDYFATPATPFILMLGGAKLETKLPLLQKLIQKADKVLIAGQSAFPLLRIAGKIDLKNTIVDNNNEVLVTQLWNEYNNKIILPIDFTFANNQAMDIGGETIELFKTELNQAKIIFWNGPLGKYEDEQFALGTKEIARHIASLKNSHRVIGGGDTVSVLDKKLQKSFDHISMGGGATLSYLSSL